MKSSTNKQIKAESFVVRVGAEFMPIISKLRAEREAKTGKPATIKQALEDALSALA